MFAFPPGRKLGPPWFSLRTRQPANSKRFNFVLRGVDSHRQRHQIRRGIAATLQPIQQDFRLFERFGHLGEPSGPRDGGHFNRSATHIRPPAVNSIP